MVSKFILQADQQSGWWEKWYPDVNTYSGLVGDEGSISVCQSEMALREDMVVMFQNDSYCNPITNHCRLSVSVSSDIFLVTVFITSCKFICKRKPAK